MRRPAAAAVMRRPAAAMDEPTRPAKRPSTLDLRPSTADRGQANDDHPPRASTADRGHPPRPSTVDRLDDRPPRSTWGPRSSIEAVSVNRCLSSYGIDEGRHWAPTHGDPLVCEQGFPIRSNVLGEHFHHTVAMHLNLCMDEFSLVVGTGGRSDCRRALVLTEPVQDQVGRFCSFHLVKHAG